MNSIKARLMLMLTLTLLIVIFLSSKLSQHVVREEVDEVFNAELVFTAEIIKGLINKPDFIKNRDVLSQSLNETLAGLASIPPQIQIYKKKLLLQVWNQEGSNLLFKSPESPRKQLARLAKGFYHRNKETPVWDVYVTELPAIKGWLVLAEIPDARTEIDEKMGWIFLCVGMLVLLASCFMAFLAVNFGLKPLQRLGAMLAGRSLTNLEPIHLEKPVQELTPVISGINQLFLRLTHGLERERRFVADAAHELRTPLAVLKIRTQYLQSTAGQEYQQDIQQLLEGVERGHRLVEQLLILARFDERQNFPESTLIDVIELARCLVADLYEQSLQNDCVMEIESPLEVIQYRVNPVLLELVLRNLLKNALRYGGPGNHIVLEIHKSESRLFLSVKDRGPGVAEEDLTRLCDRFYRGKNANSMGAGLGLSIVKRIVEGLNGRLWFENREGGGFIASVQLDALGPENTHH